MNLRKLLVLACLAGALLALGSQLDAQPKTPPEMSDDPEVQKKLTQLADGFELQLVASEPEIKRSSNPSIANCLEERFQRGGLTRPGQGDKVAAFQPESNPAHDGSRSSEPGQPRKLDMTKDQPR